jgi:uncharacterized protein (TIGR02996 family)
MPAPHPDEAAFLAAVRAAPEDNMPRLAFADWLEEHGEGERGEFIRVQVELARWREDAADVSPSDEGITNHLALRRQEQQLLRDLARTMLGDAVGPPFTSEEGVGWQLRDNRAVYAEFHRGFVAEVRCPLAAFRGRVAALFRVHPVERVTGWCRPRLP